jgi:hypothetical protein
LLITHISQIFGIPSKNNRAEDALTFAIQSQSLAGEFDCQTALNLEQLFFPRHTEATSKREASPKAFLASESTKLDLAPEEFLVRNMTVRLDVRKSGMKFYRTPRGD